MLLLSALLALSDVLILPGGGRLCLAARKHLPRIAESQSEIDDNHFPISLLG